MPLIWCGVRSKLKLPVRTHSPKLISFIYSPLRPVIVHKTRRKGKKFAACQDVEPGEKNDERRIVLQMRRDFVGDCGSIWMRHSATSAVEFEMLLWQRGERIIGSARNVRVACSCYMNVPLYKPHIYTYIYISVCVGRGV